MKRVISKEQKQLRMNILGGMNEYVRNYISDENVIEHWLEEGCPDECTEDDLEFMATDEDTFMNACKLFGWICGMDYLENK